MNGILLKLLESPCIFCKYQGEKYWQPGSHLETCPWHQVGGLDVRVQRLVKSLSRMLAMVNAGEKRGK